MTLNPYTVCDTQGNYLKGGGVESRARYEGSEVVHLGIENIHVVRTAYRGLVGASGEGGSWAVPPRDVQQKWLVSISSILAGALLCADKVPQTSRRRAAKEPRPSSKVPLKRDGYDPEMCWKRSGKEPEKSRKRSGDKSKENRKRAGKS
jgi:hypothetical protein